MSCSIEAIAVQLFVAPEAGQIVVRPHLWIFMALDGTT